MATRAILLTRCYRDIIVILPITEAMASHTEDIFAICLPKITRSGVRFSFVLRLTSNMLLYWRYTPPLLIDAAVLDDGALSRGAYISAIPCYSTIISRD